jgi:hypothetical protein
MNRTVKLGLGIVVALVVALSAAWLWGSSGTRDLQRALDAADLRNDLLDARGAALSARVDLYVVNFGDASRDFEAARAALRRAESRLKWGWRWGGSTKRSSWRGSSIRLPIPGPPKR